MSSRRIELALHQRWHQVHDRDIHALLFQTRGGFKAQQPATDHNGAAARFGCKQHGLHVVQIAVGQNAGKAGTGNRDDNRARAGCDDELVIGYGLTDCRGHGPRVAIDLCDRHPLIERDAVLHIPAVAMDDDLIEGLVAREHRRQHDAVVVHARLGVEDRNVIRIGRALDQALKRTSGGHPIAYDDKPLLHRVLLALLQAQKNAARQDASGSVETSCPAALPCAHRGASHVRNRRWSLSTDLKSKRWAKPANSKKDHAFGLWPRDARQDHVCRWRPYCRLGEQPPALCALHKIDALRGDGVRYPADAILLERRSSKCAKAIRGQTWHFLRCPKLGRRHGQTGQLRTRLAQLQRGRVCALAWLPAHHLRIKPSRLRFIRPAPAPGPKDKKILVRVGRRRNRSERS